MTMTQTTGPALPIETVTIDGDAYRSIARTELAITGGTAVVDALEGDFGSIDIVTSITSASQLRALIAELQALETIAEQVEQVAG